MGETWLGREKNPLTKDWKEENDGLTDDISPYEFPNTALNLNENEENTRKLKGEPEPLPEELIFEVAINGEIKSAWNRDELEEQRHNVAYNVDVFVLLDDPTMREKFNNKDDDVGETIEVAIRLKNIGREATFA